MIDPLVEELISPNEAAKLYPRGPGGKKVHVGRVYRHMKRGVRGILLEAVCTPRLATSREAIARFFRALSALRPAADARGGARPGHRERAVSGVGRELDQLGL